MFLGPDRHPLRRAGRWLEHLDDCPATVAVARRVAGLQVAAILRMAPGTRLRPHRDLQDPPFVNFHLVLQVDRGRAWIRVGEEVRHLRSGDCYGFDPRCEHECANDGDRDRVLLYLAVHAHLAGMPLQAERAVAGGGDWRAADHGRRRVVAS